MRIMNCVPRIKARLSCAPVGAQAQAEVLKHQRIVNYFGGQQPLFVCMSHILVKNH